MRHTGILKSTILIEFLVCLNTTEYLKEGSLSKYVNVCLTITLFV